MNSVSHTFNHQYQRYFDIDMQYQIGANNHQKSIHRTRITVLIVTRFGIVSPVLIRWLYNINQHQALGHLNKLVAEGLLQVAKTHRSPDGRVYVSTYSAAKFAEELSGTEVYFRSQSNPQLQFNHNNVMHNLINAFVMLRGIHNVNKAGERLCLWSGFVTEPEYKRVTHTSDTRNVDGLVIDVDGNIAAIEIEHSFKSKTTRQAILLKYLSSLKAGHYAKVFMFSQSNAIFDDIKRLHGQLFEDLPTRIDKKTRLPIITYEDAELLRAAIIYRTKFCDEINALFYL